MVPLRPPGDTRRHTAVPPRPWPAAHPRMPPSARRSRRRRAEPPPAVTAAPTGTPVAARRRSGRGDTARGRPSNIGSRARRPTPLPSRRPAAAAQEEAAASSCAPIAVRHRTGRGGPSLGTGARDVLPRPAPPHGRRCRRGPHDRTKQIRPGGNRIRPQGLRSWCPTAAAEGLAGCRRTDQPPRMARCRERPRRRRPWGPRGLPAGPSGEGRSGGGLSPEGEGRRPHRPRRDDPSGRVGDGLPILIPTIIIQFSF
jgi:hypothetical protein